MSRWEIKLFDYDSLPKEIDKESLSNNGECADYLVLYLDGEVYDYRSDAMEPEDTCFIRDLSFIMDWVNRIIEDYNYEGMISNE